MKFDTEIEKNSSHDFKEFFNSSYRFKMSFKFSCSFLDGFSHGDNVSYQLVSVLTYPFFSIGFDDMFNVFDGFLNDFDGIFSPFVTTFLTNVGKLTARLLSPYL